VKKKNLFLRVDSGIEIGLGHMMRCLALAKVIKNMGFNVYFISKENEGNIIKYIENSGFRVFRLKLRKFQSSKTKWKMDSEETSKIIRNFKDDYNLILVDNYYLSIMWEKQMRKVVNKIIVIDDLMNRNHDCDLFIDQNLHKKIKTNLPKKCKKLLGPKYALLQKEFSKRNQKRKIKQKIKNLLISFGGGDDKNQTIKALEAIKKFGDKEILVDVIVGNSNKNKELIKKKCIETKNFRYHHQITNMAQFMNKADLAIGAGGISTWERCFTGLPSIAIIISKNQEEGIIELSKKNCLINLGKSGKVTKNDYLNTIMNLESKKLSQMSRECMKLVDGKGTIRVAKHISLIVRR